MWANEPDGLGGVDGGNDLSPFADWQVPSGKRRGVITLEALQRSLAGGEGSAATVDDVATLQRMRPEQFGGEEGFRDQLEWGTGFHGSVHNAIGGTMASGGSAGAPEFFLHHAMVDKVWADWQAQSAEHTQAYVADGDYELDDNLPRWTGTFKPEARTVADYLDWSAQRNPAAESSEVIGVKYIVDSNMAALNRINADEVPESSVVQRRAAAALSNEAEDDGGDDDGEYDEGDDGDHTTVDDGDDASVREDNDGDVEGDDTTCLKIEFDEQLEHFARDVARLSEKRIAAIKARFAKRNNGCVDRAQFAQATKSPLDSELAIAGFSKKLLKKQKRYVRAHCLGVPAGAACAADAGYARCMRCQQVREFDPAVAAAALRRKNARAAEPLRLVCDGASCSCPHDTRLAAPARGGDAVRRGPHVAAPAAAAAAALVAAASVAVAWHRARRSGAADGGLEQHEGMDTECAAGEPCSHYLPAPKGPATIDV